MYWFFSPDEIVRGIAANGGSQSDVSRGGRATAVAQVPINTVVS